MKRLLLLSLSFFTLTCSQISAQELKLYTDTTTGQIFSTPGKNRVLLGNFVETKELEQKTQELQNKVVELQNELKTDSQANAKELKNEILAFKEETKADMKPKIQNKWFDKIKIGGYMQFRNTFTIKGKGENNHLWTDKSVGDDSNFIIRRARLIIAANAGDHLYIYLQPDFASSTSSGTNHVAQLRDFYGDIYIDKTKIHRIRVGQSKVPFGFENMQSSSKRLALDRNDGLNSAVRDERDIGAFYYYTPIDIQNLFNEIDAKKLKSTGNYGMFGFGFYNGQGANRTEANDNNHMVARLTYPFKTKSGQIYEFGVQGYTGKYTSSTGSYINNGSASAAPVLENTKGIKDERVGISAIMYQQPFGIQAEWNWGSTPGLDFNDNTIKKQSLHGGYIQTMYAFNNVLKSGDLFTPFAKWQYFDGYSKAERNSPKNKVNDWEIGVEWQMAKEVELSLIYHLMKRNDLVTVNKTSNGSDYEIFSGSSLRVQAQINY